MGSINGIFNTSDNFDDLIEEKLDSLDMWIKKIEKSNNHVKVDKKHAQAPRHPNQR